ncbi:hypothetical protein ABS784_07075 [Geobacillus sp. G4]|uniref:Uncharacterized protein n=9 Tax=Geobacillus TaxID=129337 RepID=A0A1Q5SXW7_9BACL|nr:MULTISPECIES: hypothetical protein [Geobacillus]AEV18282.1 hypothetical protein GTCCBUS3UF5_9610 [Geobacillus thermoleovorans CCB_US3_UF5]AMV10095.1 hypothetical protein GT3570_03935 [Geobacillus thermoleovorans]AST00285.1 hypothetical protein GT3921_15380 [Geobacillus thermocatenulatus]AUI36172.1 hypothetical protein CWI35_06160 [[Bacillus] caldolyticus]AWO73643.1 hypothetical protein C1N76_03010 [Geobacillus thermoleovorans]
MVRLFFYLVGFGFSVVGGMMVIAYLNIITPERGFSEYLSYISTRVECYLFPIGLLLMWGSLTFPSRSP